MLNTMVAEELSQFYDSLKDADDVETAAKQLIKEVLTAHQRIIFNGDNYSEEWVAEAERRGLLNLRSLPEALSHFLDQKNIDLFVKHNICTEAELRARCEIDLEAYSKQLNIEALTMIDMAQKDILPAVTAFIREQVDAALAKKALSAAISAETEEKLAASLSEKQARFAKLIGELAASTEQAAAVKDPLEQAFAYRNLVFSKMEELRAVGDSMEAETAADYWPYPSYTDLLFGV
jgi:glutamine synthetase